MPITDDYDDTPTWLRAVPGRLLWREGREWPDSLRDYLADLGLPMPTLYDLDRERRRRRARRDERRRAARRDNR